MNKRRIQELETLLVPFKTISKTTDEIIEGKFLKISKAEYKLALGKTIVREELIKGDGISNAVIILPLTENNEVLLTIQPRVHTKTGVGVELPAGYIEKNETGYEAALRELEEETGYLPKEIISVHKYYQDQGCSKAYNECFLATGCQKKSTQKLDCDEYIKEYLCTYQELLALIDMEYICDAGSIITVERSKKLIESIMK